MVNVYAFVLLRLLADALAVPVTSPAITDGSLRLVNGSKPSNGRLEVYYNGTWGTVCDDRFGLKETTVACRILGYSDPPYEFRPKAVYGEGSGPIWLDNVHCFFGNETSLTYCLHEWWGAGNCQHNEDVGLKCETDDRVRLVDGWKSSEGRVEVYHNGVWGTVCDDGWDVDTARILCKTLDFDTGNSTPEVHTGDFYGRGSGEILLDEMSCTGTEENIFVCGHSEWGHDDCNHGEDVGVDCQPGSANTVDVRLIDGWKRSEGRVEVNYHGEAGTVCSDNFGNVEASVVCTMLGYSGTNAVAKPGGYYGSGTGQIVLDDLDCQGNEASIFLCQHSTFGTSDCLHKQDVGVDCEPGSNGSFNRTDIRLVGGSRPSEGRLELFHDGEWGTVCSSNWDFPEAVIVCSMLGYTGSASVPHGPGYYGPGSGRSWLGEVTCVGNETSIIDCQHRINRNCVHSRDVGVDCRPELDGNATTVRLVNGSRSSEGRVEVYHGGHWGTVCDHKFGRQEATVICKMLGFPGPTYAARTGAYYGEGVSEVWLDELHCLGNESNVFACQHKRWGQESCTHRRDAGVDCEPRVGNNSMVRLVNGSKMSEGRVEVQINGVWGTVCESGFSQSAAKVVCDMLGYNGTNPVVKSRAHFGQGQDPVWIHGTDCTGNETSLFECSLASAGSNHFCRHYRDVGVDCTPAAQCLKSVFDCPSKAFGDYPSCRGCGFYVSCSSSGAYLRPCPSGLKWDDKQKSCQFTSSTCNGP